MAYCSLWKKVVVLPVHRLCRAFATRFGFRKTGLLTLSRDIQACEYEDVHIMWDMLRKTETNTSPQTNQEIQFSKLLKINQPRFHTKVFGRIISCYMPMS